MPLPEFTEREQYLINFVKAPDSEGQSTSYMWGYLTGGAVVAGFGAYHANIPMVVAGFIIVCGFRIYEEHYQRKWMPLWKSILSKYEAALDDDSQATSPSEITAPDDADAPST